mgnify:CR=1 FL=1
MSTDVREKFDGMETDDVAEKRLKMFKIFEEILSKRTGFDDSVKGLKELKDSNGYLFKLSQDFLLSSSTMNKERKLEKIIEYVE